MAEKRDYGTIVAVETKIPDLLSPQTSSTVEDDDFKIIAHLIYRAFLL
jgi:hypothetical protein